MLLQEPLQPVTADFYRQMPLGPPYYQLIQGNLIMSPSASFRHQRVLGRLFNKLENYLEKNPLGIANLAPSDVLLNQITILQPDLYFIKNENKHKITVQGVDGAPDLVVEILSPSHRDQDRTIKRDLYRQAGVPEMWILDPEAETLELQALNPPDIPQIFRRSDVFQPGLFPGLSLSLEDVFRSI